MRVTLGGGGGGGGGRPQGAEETSPSKKDNTRRRRAATNNRRTCRYRLEYSSHYTLLLLLLLYCRRRRTITNSRQNNGRGATHTHTHANIKQKQQQQYWSRPAEEYYNIIVWGAPSIRLFEFLFRVVTDNIVFFSFYAHTTRVTNSARFEIRSRRGGSRIRLIHATSRHYFSRVRIRKNLVNKIEKRCVPIRV